MVEKYTQILDEVCDPLTVRKFTEMSSLSRNEAISLLEKYVKSKGEPVWALYEIRGIVDSSEYSFLPAGEKLTKHIVVPESSLDETKTKFTEIVSTCLHSIQRTNPKDTRVYGRSWADNDDLKGKTLPQQKPQKTVTNSTVEVKKDSSAEPEQKPSSSDSSKPIADTKKGTIAPMKKQANISNMFSKKSQLKSEKKEESVSPPPPEQEKKARKRPKVEVDEPEELPSVDESKEKTPEKKKQKKIVESPKSERDYPSSREQSVEKEKSPPAKRKKSSVNDENKKAKKRLIVPDSDEEETPEPMEVEEKKTEVRPISSERRRTTRIEKIVETYVDEDGYLVSKEVQKAVECSPQKLTPEKPKAKVITAPIPGAAKGPKKNSTITSFFKKA